MKTGISSKKKTIEENNSKNYKISRISVDSKDRIRESKNQLDRRIKNLIEDPLSIIYNDLNDSDVFIYDPGHNYNIDDNIVIQGVESINITLENGLEFIQGSNFVKVNHKNHNLNFETNNNINIEISNFIGNMNNKTEYNDIPINLINGYKKIYAVRDSQEIKNNDYYYISLGEIKSKFSEVYNSSYVKIIFDNINGIDLNLLNANFPRNNNQLYGFHTITEITDTGYMFKLNSDNNISILNKGGSKIWVSKVNNFTPGYQNNNFYKISFKKTFNNVSKIKLISTEIPNTERAIKDRPESKKNNCFYWKLLSDGEKEYKIEIDSGNYSVELLRSTLVQKIESTKRPSLTITNENVTDYSFYDYNLCSINIEPENDTFEIEFKTTIFIPNSITYVEPNNFNDKVGRLRIKHPKHGLTAGTNINIINATQTNSIPQEVINNSFEIEEIVDENYYLLKLPKYNISSTNTSITNGGDSMGVTFPVKSQLLLDKSDNICKLLGFRNVGEPRSITKFEFTINNRQSYLYDNNINYNSINLSGNNYIFMTCPLFTDSVSSGNVNGTFAKLFLTSEPGSIIYNEFIQLGENFERPLKNLSEWEVSFIDVDGELYDFGNLEHSYTLEIYENLEINSNVVNDI